MDFELNEEQRAIQETARRVVQKELPRPLVLQRVKNGVEPPRELFWKLGAMGMYRFLMPPAFGRRRSTRLGCSPAWSSSRGRHLP
jgi:alkylation response protein AidB-like acyl-CoA dehydrogenase